MGPAADAGIPDSPGPVAGGAGGDAGIPPAPGTPAPTVPGTWRWENPLPSGADLNAVWAVAADDVWAAGAGGAVVHFDGAGWRSVAAPTNVDLLALWGTGAANLWAAGDKGTLLHYDGAAWSSVTSGTTARLGVISGTAADDVWVSSPVGPASDPTPAALPDAALLHFDGKTWTRLPVSGATAVAAIARDDVWVGTCGATLHFDGKSWASYPTPEPPLQPGQVAGGCVRAIAGVAAGLLFQSNERADECHPHSIATYNCRFEELLRFDGAGWNQAIDGPRSGLLIAAQGTMWSLVSGYTDTLFRLDGSSWTEVANDRVGSESMMTPASRAFAVAPGGQEWVVGSFGRIKHFDGSSLAKAFPAADLISLAGSSECDVWAVGSNATVLRRDCTGHWAAVDLVAAGVIPPENVRTFEDGDLQTVASAAPDDAWIQDASGKLMHFDGATWTAELLPARGTVIAVARGDLYLASGTGLLHRTAGRWESIPIFSQRPVGPISASGPDDVWVFAWNQVGSDLYHFDGTGWSLVRPVGNVGTLLAGSGPNDAWLTGFPGGLHHFDGANWTNVPTPIFDFFLATSGGPGRFWAEDGSGDWLFDGHGWTNYPSGASRLPFGYFHRGLFHVGHTLFAIGFAGEILSRPDR